MEAGAIEWWLAFRAQVLPGMFPFHRDRDRTEKPVQSYKMGRCWRQNSTLKALLFELHYGGEWGNKLSSFLFLCFFFFYLLTLFWLLPNCIHIAGDGSGLLISLRNVLLFRGSPVYCWLWECCQELFLLSFSVAAGVTIGRKILYKIWDGGWHLEYPQTNFLYYI